MSRVFRIAKNICAAAKPKVLMEGHRVSMNSSRGQKEFVVQEIKEGRKWFTIEMAEVGHETGQPWSAKVKGIEYSELGKSKLRIKYLGKAGKKHKEDVKKSEGFRKRVKEKKQTHADAGVARIEELGVRIGDVVLVKRYWNDYMVMEINYKTGKIAIPNEEYDADFVDRVNMLSKIYGVGRVKKHIKYRWISGEFIQEVVKKGKGYISKS